MAAFWETRGRPTGKCSRQKNGYQMALHQWHYRWVKYHAIGAAMVRRGEHGAFFRQGGPLDGQTCNRFGPEKKNSIHKATEAIKTWAFVVTVNPTTIVK